MREIIERDIPEVKKLCQKVIGENYQEIERLGGLTNHTYHVKMKDGKQYAVRIPGDGTEELIVRSDEKKSTELACKLGIDAQCLYFGENGAKVTEYINDAITMSAETMKDTENIKQVADILKKLHCCEVNTKVPFEVFDMAGGYEKIIAANNVTMYEDYEEIKRTIMNIKEKVDLNCDIKKVPCHNDPLCENWVKDGRGKMYLIDWEYAGMNDGMWDLADISIEAMYGKKEDEELLIQYLGYQPTKINWMQFFANKVYVDYLWTLWAKARVPFDGQTMEDWANERYSRLKESLNQLNRYI